MAADDRALLLDMFERLGDESRYRPFLTPKKRLTESELTALTAVDHHDYEALVAILPDGDEEKGRGDRSATARSRRWRWPTTGSGAGWAGQCSSSSSIGRAARASAGSAR